MKKFITKTNAFLIEKFPNIWNTKIVWVLLVSIILHGIFFIFGLLTFTNPESLHDMRAKDIYFENGTIFMNIILFIIIIVVWLSYLFKNNAFKSLYPLKRKHLFGHLLMYILIVFCTSSFYISYNYGLKTYISFTYEDEKVIDEVLKSNKAALFFSHKLEDYTLEERKYPAPFDTLYCSHVAPKNLDEIEYIDDNYEIVEKKVDSSLPHLSFFDEKYYYYTLYTKTGSSKQEAFNSEFKGYVYYRTKDTIRTYYYKDKVFDITTVETSALPSYYNYSSRFYRLNEDSNARNYYRISSTNPYTYNEGREILDKKVFWNKEAYDLLQRNNPKEIKQTLTDLLAICDTYKVKHNLTPDTWFSLVYHPEDFKLKALIREEPKEEFAYFNNANKTELETFKENLLTDYFIETDKLYNLFDNVEDIKESTPFSDSIHVYLWLSFVISAMILMFRTTGLKTFILTIVTAGVVSIFIGLSATVYDHIMKYPNRNTEYFVTYLSLIITIVILLVPILFSQKLKKIIVGICVNLSLVSFMAFILLVMGLISIYQNDYCRSTEIRPCDTIWDVFGIYWSPILFIINLIILYFYTKVIKNWKALPEA
ncbi:hypothetical protein [Seonamhaeicola marinus]|uniref:Uncharacterized protein n=1 Tax=Seonamhaeicola marinus TaxID=1912246 RepID=A0A5D0JCF9_9FLAO|nr:hypothetical protein [Seonamhaeicola marinus]TYA92257.1 hypothetical protein FUA24_02150 [Seonamhaeicola marinus]